MQNIVVGIGIGNSFIKKLVIVGHSSSMSADLAHSNRNASLLSFKQ